MINKETFKQLFEKYTSGTMDGAERELFFQWIKENPNDPLIGDLMDDLYKYGSAKDQHENLSGQARLIPMRRSRRLRLFFQLAAAVLILAVAGLSIIWFNRSSDNYKTKLAGNGLQTQKAESQYVLLSDSTQVWVNASTDLRYPKKFDQDKREVYLEGEAFFDVKHADKVPFIIYLPGKTSVTVLGTAFNIKAFPDRQQVIVSVTRGRVSVKKEDKLIKVLTVGQEVRVGIDDNSTAFKEVSVDKINNGQSGIVFFDDLPLKDVVKDISQQKNVDIRIENEKLANTVINTSFDKSETVKGMLDVIKAMTDCQIKNENGAYIIY